MSQANMNRLSNYRNRLTEGSGDVDVINNRLSEMFDQFSDAVKGDYYAVSYGDFSGMKEKSPGNDGYISSARSNIKKEIEAIEQELEEERKRKEAQAQAGPSPCPGPRP